MEQAEPTNSRPVQERPYRYHRWNNTVIRERGILDVEYLSPAGWALSSYAVDALTGMGEDPYSCGEWADEVSEAEAAEIAEARGLSLAMEREDAAVEPQSVPRRRVPGSAWRWLPGRARRRLFGG